MTVLLSLLHLIAGAVLAGLASSSVFCVLLALVGLMRGRFSLLAALIWPALVWFLLLPLCLLVIGMVADEWGHKTQVFMLVSLAFVGIPGVIMAIIGGVSSGWMEPER
jgi:hypothetical protein